MSLAKMASQGVLASSMAATPLQVRAESSGEEFHPLPTGTSWDAQDLQPSDLLNDGVHLNAHGVRLMAEIVKAHLVRRPEFDSLIPSKPPAPSPPAGGGRGGAGAAFRPRACATHPLIMLKVFFKTTD